MVQWLRLHATNEEFWIGSLARKLDPTCQAKSSLAELRSSAVK